MKFDSNNIGKEGHCFIIAEAGVNHNGDIKIAKALIDAAYAAGANAVKFQSFKADKLATLKAPKAEYQKESTDANESQFDMLKRLELSEEDHYNIADHCKKKGLLFLSTPFDEESAEFLNKMGMPIFKIPSGEITNHGLLEHIAQFRKPILLSTGMSTLDEVTYAVNAIQKKGKINLTLLHCVSNYPANPEHINLRAMITMREKYELPVGYSDHSLGTEIAFAAIALGACVLEKHFTLDRNMPGPDHSASIEAGELGKLVKGVRAVEAALGDGEKNPASDELAVAKVARKSLVAKNDIPIGAILTNELIQARRPGNGIPPYMVNTIIGKRTKTFISKGTMIKMEMLS